MPKKLPDCYEEEYCENAKTELCKKCERNFDNFDIADNYRYRDPSSSQEKKIEGEIVGSPVSSEPKSVECVNSTTATTPDSSFANEITKEKKL